MNNKRMLIMMLVFFAILFAGTAAGAIACESEHIWAPATAVTCFTALFLAPLFYISLGHDL